MGPKHGALTTALKKLHIAEFGGTVKPTSALDVVPLCKQTRTQASQGSNTSVRPAHVLPSRKKLSAMLGACTNNLPGEHRREEPPVYLQRASPDSRFARTATLVALLSQRFCATAPHASSPKGVLGLGTQLWWFNRVFVEQVRSWSPKVLVALLPTNMIDRTAFPED